MEIVAKRMLELRTSVNFTQLKLSKALDISQSAVNRYERNQVSVPDLVLLKYADFFDISADYLLGRTDKPEGVLFNNEPEILRRKALREDEWEEFAEACFDPRSPMNKKLKEMILKMAGGA